MPFLRPTRFPRARLGAWLAAALLTAAPAAADSLYLLVDGVTTGDAPADQPLGPGAFLLLTFTLSVDEVDASALPGPGTKPGAIKDVRFDMTVSPAVVQLSQLAAQGKVVPKAAMIAVDDATKKVRYRIDLEQVVVRSVGLQTLGTRDAANGSLGFQRIRFRFGEGKDATTWSWDRAKNAPWK